MIPIASRCRNNFFVKLRKLHLQTFWKFNTLFEINRGNFFKKKSNFTLRFLEKLNSKQEILLLSWRTQVKRRAEPWTMDLWREWTATPLCLLSRSLTGCVLIDATGVVEAKELKSTSSEERFPLEWVTTWARRVQFPSDVVPNFWAVFLRYKYLKHNLFRREN